MMRIYYAIYYATVPFKSNKINEIVMYNSYFYVMKYNCIRNQCNA